jgi:hypothetical protein
VSNQVCGKENTLRLVEHSTIILSRLFGVKQKKLDLVLEKKPGSIFDAEFDYVDGKVYLNTGTIWDYGNLHGVHTIGEEIGHKIHYDQSPHIFHTGHPTTDQFAEAINNGEYNPKFLENVLLSANLTEFVGFYSGLYLLNDRYGIDGARTYARATLEGTKDWVPESMLPIIREFATADSKNGDVLKDVDLKEHIDKSPDIECEKFVSKLKHSFGYHLASKVFELDYTKRHECFVMALKSKKISQLYGRMKQAGML